MVQNTHDITYYGSNTAEAAGMLGLKVLDNIFELGQTSRTEKVGCLIIARPWPGLNSNDVMSTEFQGCIWVELPINREAWGESNYQRVARLKLRTAYRHKMDTRDLVLLNSISLRPDDCRYPGAVVDEHFYYSFSGIEGELDHVISSTTREHHRLLCNAMATLELFAKKKMPLLEEGVVER